MLRQRRVLLHGLALFGEFEARFAAGIRLAVERLGNGGGAAHLAEFQNLDLEQAAFIFNLQHVAGVDIARWLGAHAAGEDAADVAGLAGEGAGLEEARGPEPLVDADGIHLSMVRNSARGVGGRDWGESCSGGAWGELEAEGSHDAEEGRKPGIAGG